MRWIMVLFVAALGGCANVPISATDAAALRAQAEPQAVARCAALGFTTESPMPAQRCVESVIASYMESRVPWSRLRAAGLNFTGDEEVEALALCIANGTTATSVQMPACFQAQRILAIRRQEQQATETNLRSAQIRAMAAPIQIAPRTCIRSGNTVNCY